MIDKVAHRWMVDKFMQLAQERRHRDPSDWQQRERIEMTAYVNRLAEAYGWPNRCTVADFDAADQRALGHTDYMHKVCMYLIETTCYPDG